MITILDALARALEARGLSIELPGGHMRVAVAPDDLTFSLVERIEKRPHVLTMEELAAEERQKKKRERETHVSLWSLDYKRAYLESTLSDRENRAFRSQTNISGCVATGPTANGNDWKTSPTTLQVGLAAYLAGIQASEERERWHRNWERQRHLDALARAREERERKRAEFESTAAISAEADQLKSLVARLRGELKVNRLRQNWCAHVRVGRCARFTARGRTLTHDGITSALGEEESVSRA